jgi:hypothetical protein
MPNNTGLILYPPCVHASIFKEEFIVEMVDCLGKSYWVPPVGHVDPHLCGITSWYAGRTAALQLLADEAYAVEGNFGTQVKPLRLKMRSLHHDVGHCDECNDIQRERTDARRQRLGPDALEANDRRQKVHTDMYMGERRALETLRQSGARGGILFCMRGKCGDELMTASTYHHIRVQDYQIRANTSGEWQHSLSSTLGTSL